METNKCPHCATEINKNKLDRWLWSNNFKAKINGYKSINNNLTIEFEGLRCTSCRERFDASIQVSNFECTVIPAES